MKKTPWGIIAGICFIALFYVTAGIVAAYIILNAIAAATNHSIGLFENWWQTLLFVFDLILAIGFVGSLVMYILVHVGVFNKSNEIKPQKVSVFDKVTSVVLKRSSWGLITAFFAVFLTIVYLGSSIATEYSAQINSALGINQYQVENSGTDGSDYYKSDYYLANGKYDDVSMRNNSMDVAERTADESTTILWNNNQALPLSQNSKVGIFGISAQKSKYLYTGTGSGHINYTGSEDIKSALENDGMDVDNNLWTLYRLASATYGGRTVGAAEAGVDDKNYGEYRINEAPWSALQDLDSSTFSGAVLADYSKYQDAAIMVISRNGGEDYDTNFKDAQDNNLDNYNYLDLSEAEADVLQNLTQLKSEGKIKKVVLLINSASAMQFMNISKYDIDACLWVGMGGNVAAEQIADAISGKTTPSGHLVDTYAYENYSAPATENFGDHTFSASSGLPETYTYSHNDKYLVYQEGIYVGYKYYETRYEDTVLGNGNASSTAGVYGGESNWNYDDEVAFPFGYGLSYTDFSYSDYSVAKDSDGNYDVSVTITNDGDTYSGKDVFQVYIQKPYTDYDKTNGIEKSSVELDGFAKTKELAPGESQTLSVTIKPYDLKTYDSYNKKTYILEKGDYYIACGKDSHDALNNILAEKGYTTSDGMDANGNASLSYKVTIDNDDYTTYSTSPYTGYPVTDEFSNADINLYDGTSDQKITYLSRNDWEGTYPTKAVDMTCLDPKMIADMQYSTGIDEDENAEMPTYGKISDEYGQLSLIMLKDVDYNDPIWNALMDQTTWAEQTYLVTYGAHVFAGAESVAAPGGLSQNGPSGINQENPTLGSCMIFPCEVNMAATWNTDLINELGNAFGMEMMHVGYTGLNGPGANIHRCAYSGRNWEYYSEDGFMSSEMFTAESAGLQNRGAILFTKHMLLNDQERNRYGVSIWANEQSIRELYAKSFEKACAEGHLNGIMSSFNRIGTTWAGKNKGLLTELLRNEWGFEGAVETDAAVGRHMGVANTDAATDAAVTAEALIAGQDFWLGGGSTTKLDAYKDNPTVAVALREAARRVLFAQLHSTAMNGISSSTRIVKITPWWENLLDELEVTSICLVGVSALVTVTSFVVPFVKKHKKSAKS